SEEIVSQVIQEVSKQRVTFVIAHRLSTIKNATKIAVFKSGKILDIGTYDELLNRCDEFKRLHNSANI
ncbi:MAG: ABC transporter ATP-binding protein, partial [Arcobacter skirrowii]|nr:ABC transporter ATP-binding protein [Aliarcobacter skirrowii]